ncbi:MAG: metallophosphoesterase [Polyangiales bacterium]
MRWAQMLIFLGVLTAMTGGLHWFLWARLVRDPGWAVEVTRWATRALWALAATIPLSLLLMRALPRPVMSALAWVAYVWMGLAFFLFMFLLVGWGVKAIAVAVDPSRREAMARLLAAGGGLAALATGAVAIRVALDRVMVRTVRVTIPKLPAAFEGMSIVQLTDIHVGPTIGKDFIEGLVSRCNALDPDVVVITGDLVDGSVAELAEHVAPLRGLRAREGVFFVTGNHEYYSGVDEWLAHLGGMGCVVLRNERVALTRDGESIDPRGGRLVGEAVEGGGPRGRPRGGAARQGRDARWCCWRTSRRRCRRRRRRGWTWCCRATRTAGRSGRGATW